MLETNINKHKNQTDRILEDVDNKAKTESAASKNVPSDITNDDVPKTSDNNELESTSVSTETEHKLLTKQTESIGRKKEKTEDITKENMDIGENDKENSINSTDELMNILRRKYTGISEYVDIIQNLENN